LIGEVPIREASYDGVASQMLRYASLRLPLNQSVVDARAELDATPPTVQDALAKYVRPDGFVRVVTGPAPK
jgi:zinc protease